MNKEHVLLAVLWIAFCFCHSFFADNSVKQWFSQRMGKKFVFYRLYYTLFAAVTFAAVILYQISISSHYVFERTTLSYAAGSLFGVAGLIIMLICIKKYFMSLSGLRTLVKNEEKQESILMITGIHRHVRHPLYLGTFLFIWGLWLVFPSLSLLIANVIITLYTLYGITLEEKKLEEEFGDQYKKYKQNVPKILPFKRRNPVL